MAQKIHAVPLGAYDRLIGLELEDVSADGCITEAPCGGGPDRPVPGGPAHTGLQAPHGHRGRRRLLDEALEVGWPI